MAVNEIYQYSVIPALMSGLSSGTSSISISDLLRHGSFGIGTFENMDGEMVVIDGIAYQLKADGSIKAVSGDTKVPFAMVTRFKASQSHSASFRSKEDIEKAISEALPNARNTFALVKVTGTFKKMKVRAIPAQEYPGQLLSELAKKQSVHEYENVKGSIVGLRSPAWSSGVSVVGLHAHFIDDERTIGGHILEMSTDGDVEIGFAACTKVNIHLPESEEFGSRDLDLDQEGVKKAES